MARVTGFTAERMLEIEGTTIIGGTINAGGHLILSRRDGFTIDAGEVKGAKGDHGSGVYDVEITYQAANSGTIEPTGEWTTTVPIVHAGQYLWVKTLTTYADPEDPDISFTTTTFTVTRQPEKGSDGRGITGQTVQYQEGNSGVTTPTGNWLGSVPPVAPGKYLWTQTITTYTDGSTNTAYSVAKQGSDGTPGVDGSDGLTPYLHVAYANSADGVEDFSTTDPAGRSYMGTATSFKEPDPTDPSVYGWSLIRGASGTGISSSSVRYQASTSGTITPVGTWLVEVPHVSEGEFLWSRSITNFTDGASQTVYSVSKQGERGQDGADGRGITSIVEEYYLSDSSTSRTGGTWSTTRPDWAAGKYFWTRSTINYTSGNPTTTDPICVSGESGSSGSDGRSIVDVDVYYYLSNSSTSLIGGSWGTIAPEWTDGKYMWSKTVTTYSSGDPTESTPVCITGSSGQKGEKGDEGESIVSQERFYLMHDSLPPSPDVLEPNSWSKVEPAYDFQSSDILYSVLRTIKKTGPSTTSFSWGPVSVDSKYQAAKDIWAASQARSDEIQAEAERIGTDNANAAADAQDTADTAKSTADAANSKVDNLTRVPARVEGLQVTSNVGVWGVGAQADITVSWDAVTKDVLGDPIDVVGYEVFDQDTPVAIVTDLTSTFRVPAGSGHEFVVRGGSIYGIWGDVSTPTAAVAASPELSTRTPTAPVLSTGFGLVVARWDGTYIDGGTDGAHTVTLERKEGQTWITEGVALQETGSVTMRGVVGATVTVRFVARDMVGRVTGTSGTTSIEVRSVKGGDIDPEDIWANEAWVNALSAGIIQADWLEPNVGDSLNISANESVLIMVGRQAEQDEVISLAMESADEALAGIEGIDERVGEALGTAEDAATAAAGADLVAQNAQERLDEISAVTRFSIEGIELGTADWSQELRLRPDYAAIVQNGTEVSRWEAGRMIVNEMVVNQARIANHLFVKNGAQRTIVRPIT